MASNPPPSRACRSCNQLKARCYPSQSSPDSCARCQAAGKECVYPGKRRRPRDRIAELEAQVAGLTKALRQQHLSQQAEPKGASDRGNEALLSQHEDDTSKTAGSMALRFLDTRVGEDIQRRAVEMFAGELLQYCPAFSATDATYATLRDESPVLLFSIITFPGSQLLPPDSRQALVDEATKIFSLEAVFKPRRRIELIWALLVASFWFWSQPGASHVTIYQLVQLATGMAVDIGIGGAENPVTPGAGDSETPSPDSPGSRRAWLTCFLAASTLSVGLRRHDIHAQWTSHHAECFSSLVSASHLDPTDRHFLHLIEAQRLHHDIANSLELCCTKHIVDFTNAEMLAKMSTLKTLIDSWTAEMEGDFDPKPCLLNRYSAIIHLYEPVLHTPNSKLSFGSPIRREKLNGSDFARPTVTGERVAALYALRDACHATLDMAMESSALGFLAACPLLYVSKVFYALFVLSKIYISITAPGNTFGAVLRPTDLHFEQYLRKMKDLTSLVENLHPGSFNSRILAGYSILENWYKNYCSAANDSQTQTLSFATSTEETGGQTWLVSRGLIEEPRDSQPPQPGFEWSFPEDDSAWIDDFIPDDLLFGEATSFDQGNSSQRAPPLADPGGWPP